MIFGLEFPTIEHLVEWPGFWGDTTGSGDWHALNKIGLSALIATATTLAIYFIAASKAVYDEFGSEVANGAKLIDTAISLGKGM